MIAVKGFTNEALARLRGWSQHEPVEMFVTPAMYDYAMAYHQRVAYCPRSTYPNRNPASRNHSASALAMR